MGAEIRFLRATAGRWATVNPVLDDGEPGYEKGTNRWKVGNGITAWNDLPYMGQDPDAAVTFQDLDDHINSQTPHPVYDDGPTFTLLYENAKV